MRPLFVRLTVPLLATALIGAGCAAPYQGRVYEKGGKEYGVTSGYIWRSNWWNFYERGQSYASGGYLAEAAQDFRWAIERRAADQRDARTYGMHFLDDYFPHRELGIVLFRQKELAGAQQELIASLEQTPSARAKFYLNEVRRAVLRERDAGSTELPEIEIDSPTAGTTTRDAYVWVEGTVRSDHYVEVLDINGKRPRVELARKEMPFRARVPVAPGTNEVRIAATDLLGKTRVVTVTIAGDRTGPSVAIQEIRELGTDLEFVGVVTDASGVATLTLGDASATVGASGAVSMRVPWPVGDRLPLVAIDRAGNRTEARITLDRGGSGAGPTAGPPPGSVLLASADPAPAPLVLARDDEPPPALGERLSGLVNEVVWRLGERRGEIRDDGPPLVRLHGFEHQTGPLTVYLDRIYVVGNASDSGDVARVRVNDELVSRARGRHVLFSTTVPLAVGENRVRVIAEDPSGRRTERELVIVRVRPAIRDPQVRLTVAPMPLKQGDAVGPLSELSQGFMLDALLDQRRYRVVDRAAMAEVMRELDLGTGDLVDEADSLEPGEMVAGPTIFVGRVYQRPGSVEAWVRVVDTETADVLAMEDIYGEDPDLDGLRGLMSGLAQKLALAIPIHEGEVVGVDGDEVEIPESTDARLRPQLKVVLFRRGPMLTHPETGAPLGVDYEAVAEGRLVDVAQGTTRAALEPFDDTSAEPAPGDLLVVR